MAVTSAGCDVSLQGAFALHLGMDVTPHGVCCAAFKECEVLAVTAKAALGWWFPFLPVT